jgi:hypothetical protein
VCACEPGFLCPRCAGTPDDPGYLFEPDPREVAEAEGTAWETRVTLAEMNAGHIGGAP